MNNIIKAKSYVKTTLRYGWITRHPAINLKHSNLKYKILKRIAASPKDNFCYFRIPKVANSTIVDSLCCNMESLKTKCFDSKKNKSIINYLPSIDELENNFVFTFVRHPTTRALSAYLDKCRTAQMRQRFRCLSHGTPGSPEGFTAFLKGLRNGELYDNMHWAPQTAILPWDIKKYDFIGKYETLNEDLSFCLNYIFGPHFKIRNTNYHSTSASNKVSLFFSNYEYHLIEDLYSDDLSAFY